MHRCPLQVVGDDATTESKEQEHPTAASGSSAKQPASAVEPQATAGLLPADPSSQAIDSATAAAAAALVREAVPAQSVTATLQFLLAASIELVPLSAPLFKAKFPGMLYGTHATFASGLQLHDPAASAQCAHAARPYTLMWALDDLAYENVRTSEDTDHRGEYCPLMPYWSVHPGWQQTDPQRCAAAAALLANHRPLSGHDALNEVLRQQRELPRQEFNAAVHAQHGSTSVASTSISASASRPAE